MTTDSTAHPCPASSTSPRLRRSSPGAADPAAEELLEGLNEPQRAAVVHEGTPLLVVAGAGSGKTRVLTRRIAWLISERKAHPGSILAITFTNKAAAEMKQRVEELVGRRARIMWVSTFHSACVRILRKEITALDFGGWLQVDVLDLRRRRPEAADDPRRQGARPRPEAVPAGLAAALGLRPQERAARRRRRRPRRQEQARGDLRRGVHALPEAAAAGQRPRLRRPDHDHRPPVPAVPRRARDLPAPVPARAGRRVPGHQPRPVRPDPRAVRGEVRGPRRRRAPGASGSSRPS